MGKTRNNSRRMQQAVQSIFEDYRQKQGCLGHVYEEAACGCNNALQMWRGPKGEKGDQGPQGPKGDNAGSFLVDAEFVVNPEGEEPGSYLKLVLIDVAQQEQVVYVNLSELEDIYTAGNGIDITSMVVAAKLGAGLTFDNQGNITSAYQFCDGLDETSNVVTVKLDSNNHILGFAGSGCKGLTATVGLAPSASGVNLVLTGIDGTVLSTVPLNGSDGITIQKTANGFTWLANYAGLVSSQSGNNLSVSSTDNKLYVGDSALSYTVGEGTFTLTNADGNTSSVTVPSAVRMLDRADLVCDEDDEYYLHLTFIRDSGLHLYQDVSLACLTDKIFCNYGDREDTTAAYAKSVPADSRGDVTINSIEGSTRQLSLDEYDNVPYLLRKSGGLKSIGNTEIDKLVGGTVAWNQLIQGNDFTSTSYWACTNGDRSVADNVLTATCNYPAGSESTNFYITQPSSYRFQTTEGHKYFITTDLQFSKNYSRPVWFRFYHTQTNPTVYSDSIIYEESITAGQWFTIAGIILPARTDSKTSILIWPRTTPWYAGETIKVRNCNTHDITALFGTVIADYLYALETATPGAGVALFRKLFNKARYAYDTGTLRSVKSTAHEMVGFNLWDEQTVLGYFGSTGTWETSNVNIASENPIPVVPNTTYYLSCNTTDAIYVTYWKESIPSGATNRDAFIRRSDAVTNRTFTTPSDCHAIHFNISATYGTTYNHNICINFSSSRNGEYEPYHKESYALDDVELRGIPKLDANNQLYYDGDTYAHDGTVTRRYGIVNLGDRTWVKTTVNDEQVFYSSIPGPKNNAAFGVVCAKYVFYPTNSYTQQDKSISSYGSSTNNFSRVYIRDDAYSDASTFKTAMSGVYLVYELATPTTETADPFDSPQSVDPYGTESYVDTRDVAIPVGHDTFYPAQIDHATVTDIVSSTGDSYEIPAAIQALPGYGWGINGVNNVVDFDAGEYTQRITRINMGDLYWEYSSTYGTFGASYLHNDLSNMKYHGQLLCVKYLCSTTAGYNNLPDGYVSVTNSQANPILRVKDTAYSDAAIFKAAMDGVYLYYELETPIVTDISQYITAPVTLPVEPSGTLTFENAPKLAVPSQVTFFAGTWALEDCVKEAMRPTIDALNARIDATAVELTLDVQCDGYTLEPERYYDQVYGTLVTQTEYEKWQQGIHEEVMAWEINNTSHSSTALASVSLSYNENPDLQESDPVAYAICLQFVFGDAAWCLGDNLGDYIPLSDLLAAGTSGYVMTGLADPYFAGYKKYRAIATVDTSTTYPTYTVTIYREYALPLTADLVVTDSSANETRLDMKPFLSKIGGKLLRRPVGHQEPITIVDRNAVTPSEGFVLNVSAFSSMISFCYNDALTVSSTVYESDGSVTLCFSDPDTGDPVEPVVLYVSGYFVDSSGQRVDDLWYQTDIPNWASGICGDVNTTVSNIIASGEDGVSLVSDDTVYNAAIQLHGSLQANSCLNLSLTSCNYKRVLQLEPSCDTEIDLTGFVTGQKQVVDCVTEPVAQSFDVGINIFDGDGSTLASPVKLTFNLANPASSQEKTFSIRFGVDGQGGVSVCYPYNVFVPTSMAERTFDYFRDTTIWLTGGYNTHYTVPLSNGCIVDTWTTEDPDYPGNSAYGIVHAKLYGPKAEAPRLVTLTNGTDEVVRDTVVPDYYVTVSFSGSNRSIYPYPTANTRLYLGEPAATPVALTSTLYTSPYLTLKAATLGSNSVRLVAPVSSSAWWPYEIESADITTTLSTGQVITADLSCLVGFISYAFAREDDEIAQINTTLAGIQDYTGATSSSSGVHGLVPAATSAEKDMFLKGDGTWEALPTNHVTTDTAQTITASKTFSAGLYGNVVAMSAAAIDVSAGTVFTKTISANTTISFTNVPASPATACVTLILTNGGAYTVTWPASVKWSGGTAPDLTASGVDVLTFLTTDGGTTWYGTVNSLGAA